MKKSLQKKLMKYSLTAAAVAVSGANLNAQVHYSGLVNANVTSSYEIDLNNDQVNDFKIQVGFSSTVYSFPYSYSVKYASLKSHSSNQWIQTTAKIANYFVKPLPVSYIVSASNSWGAHSFFANMGKSTSGTNFIPSNNFIGQGDKYIGVRLNLAGGPFYGWIRVNIPSLTSNLTVVDWAYEQTAGKGIKTGQMTKLDEISIDDLNITFGPNPTTGYLKISADDNYNIEIMDLSGKIVLSALMVSNKAEFDMSKFHAGVYIAKLTNDNKTTSLKIVKE